MIAAPKLVQLPSRVKSSAYRRWRERFESDIGIPHTLANRFAQAVRYYENEEMSTARMPARGQPISGLATQEYWDLLQYLQVAGARINRESSRQGRKWLRNLAWTPTGRLRKRNPFHARHLALLAFDVNDLVFVMVDVFSQRPVYRVISPDLHVGVDLYYVPFPWQSGRKPPIVIL